MASTEPNIKELNSSSDISTASRPENEKTETKSDFNTNTARSTSSQVKSSYISQKDPNLKLSCLITAAKPYVPKDLQVSPRISPGNESLPMFPAGKLSPLGLLTDKSFGRRNSFALKSPTASFTSPLLDTDYLSKVLERCSESMQEVSNALYPADEIHSQEPPKIDKQSTAFMSSTNPIPDTSAHQKLRMQEATLHMQQKAHLLTTVYYSLVRRPQIDSLMAARQEIFDILHLEDWSITENVSPELLSAKVAIIEVSRAIIDLWNLYAAQEAKKQNFFNEAVSQIQNSTQWSLNKKESDVVIPTPPRSVRKPNYLTTVPAAQFTQPAAPKAFSDNNSILLSNKEAAKTKMAFIRPHTGIQNMPLFPRAENISVLQSLSSASLDSCTTLSSRFTNSSISKSKRTRCNFPPHIRSLLLEVFAHNQRPDLDVKKQIVTKTGLSLVQVSDWFINERRRYNHQDMERRRKYLEPKKVKTGELQ